MATKAPKRSLQICEPMNAPESAGELTLVTESLFSRGQSCEACCAYLAHAKPFEEESYGMTYEIMRTQGWKWNEIGKNEWRVNLVMPGELLFLHNENYHLAWRQSQIPDAFLQPIPSSTFRRTKRPRREEDNDEAKTAIMSTEIAHMLQRSLVPIRAVGTNSFYESAEAFQALSLANSVWSESKPQRSKRLQPRSTSDLRSCLVKQVLLAGLILPTELLLYLNRRAEKCDVCYPLRMLNAHHNLRWEGFVFVFSHPCQTLFVEVCDSGQLQQCAQTTALIASRGAATSMTWQVVYKKQPLIHESSFHATLELELGDVLYAYNNKMHDLQVAEPLLASKGGGGEAVLREVEHHELNRNISQNLLQPNPKPFFMFASESQVGRWYLCNLQGSLASCMVIDMRTSPASIGIFGMKIVPKDSTKFYFGDVFPAPEYMRHDQGSGFAHELWNLVQCDWVKEETDDAARNMRFVGGRCRMHNDSDFARRMLQYASLSLPPSSSSFLPISKIGIDLLYSELAWDTFRLQQRRFAQLGLDTTPQIMFHGVRAKDARAAVDDIVRMGFNEKHCQVAAYGAGGIYCSPQFGCALSYVSDPSSTESNFVFVCLVLVGKCYINGKANQRMAPDQHSWLENVPPYKIYCVERDGVLPCGLLHIYFK